MDKNKSPSKLAQVLVLIFFFPMFWFYFSAITVEPFSNSLVNYLSDHLNLSIAFALIFLFIVILLICKLLLKIINFFKK